MSESDPPRVSEKKPMGSYEANLTGLLPVPETRTADATAEDRAAAVTALVNEYSSTLYRVAFSDRKSVV